MKFPSCIDCKNRSRQGFAARLCREGGGFTLIEVVLALMIFALIGAIIYGALSLGHSAVAKIDVAFTRNQKLRSVSDLLASYVRSAFPYRESLQEPTVFFDGTAESVTFVSAYSQGLGGRGMAKITISKSEDGAERAAIKLAESVPVRLSNESGAAGQTHGLILQDNVKEFRLAYLDPQSDEEKWEDVWDGRERRALPRALRITYRNEIGKEINWIFPIMITVLAQ